MKPLFCFLMTIAFVLVLVAISAEKSKEFPNRLTASTTKNGETSIPGCMTQAEVSDALQRLATSDTTTEQQTISGTLRDEASQSVACRKQLVTLLISKLEKTDRDLLLNRPSFFLWHYGSKLLIDLKAVEAMDLFITNFDLHDGTPFPFNHHPALVAAASMSEEAIPALKSVLDRGGDDSTRRYAVFCLAQIGGTVAKQVLHDRLASETNCCVRNCIRASLEAFENRTFPDHISDENRTEWYTTFMCECDAALRIKISTN
jgi:hypothetical protein